MDATDYRREYALDEPGSAGTATLWRSAAVTAVILMLAIVVVGAGRRQLTPYPEFTVFHATFVFVVDLVTAFLVFGQFLYRRLLSYLILATGFLFSALVSVPFLLAFPGAIQPETSLIGGPQSAIWLWHIWHIGFALAIGASVVVHRVCARTPLSRAGTAVTTAVSGVIVAVFASVVAVTLFHERLPVLYATGETPLTTAFRIVGGTAALTTLAALWLTLPLVRQRSLLHIWIAMVLLALLADTASSLSSTSRYTVGWYFGRVESMLASSLLLLLFLAGVNRLYRDLAQRVRELADANSEKDRLLAEVRLREQEFAALVERAPDIIARIDGERRIEYINPAVERLTGKPREWFRGRPFGELGLPPGKRALWEQAIREVFTSGWEQFIEHERRLPSGTCHFQARLSPEFEDDGTVRYVLIIERDITELKRAQFALEKLILQDPLTGIANRRYLEQFIEREWQIEARHRHPVAVVMADIDHFKAYNDHYGHPQGDVCLQRVAQALLSCLHRPSDLLVRYGGEEFAAVLLETDLPAAVRLAEGMRAAVSELRLPHAASPVAPVVTVSLGVAAAPADRLSFAELLQVTDLALYRAKRNGRNRVEAGKAGCD